jgi:hypothetical protein
VWCLCVASKQYTLLLLELENDTPAGRINANEILLGNDVNLMDLLNNK